MQYTISQCFDEWPEAQNEEQAAYRQRAREVYETVNPMTLAERIACAQSESPETFELAAFLDIGVFISFYMPELIKLPFGQHHPQFFNLIPRGQRASRHNVIAPRGFANMPIVFFLFFRRGRLTIGNPEVSKALGFATRTIFFEIN